MKNFLTYLFFLTVAFLPTSAETISYAYDNAGNRIRREIVIDTKTIREAADDGIKSPDKEGRFYSEMLSEKEVRIYPNPTEGDLSVEIRGYEDSDQCSFTIFDMSGRQIVSSKADAAVTQIDITGSPDGMYVLNIVLNGRQTSWKIIKK